ncbi:MAG: hypothetical protein KF737_18505, partial [Phenylobacterium sp.]|nr:hypothetical protein [Phenylobacterium sp.]
MTRVDVAPSPVQALVPNDPTYMGARLVVTPRRLSWRGGAPPTLNEVCVMPAFEPADEPAGKLLRDYYEADVLPEAKRAPAATLGCGQGPFGPEAAGGAIAVRLAPDRMALTWYDGAILILERVAP